MRIPSPSFLLILLLALALGLSGPAAASTHGSAGQDSLTEAVICADGVIMVVLLDAQGQPVTPAGDCTCLNCLNCMQASGLALPDCGSPLTIRHREHAAPVLLTSAICVPDRILMAQPRAPPSKA